MQANKRIIDMPPEIINSVKGLINIQNKDNPCFRWCHIQHLNSQQKYPQRIKNCDKEYKKNWIIRVLAFQ